LQFNNSQIAICKGSTIVLNWLKKSRFSIYFFHWTENLFTTYFYQYWVYFCILNWLVVL